VCGDSLDSFLTLALDGMSGQLHAQAALPTNITGCLSPTASLNVLEMEKYLLPLLEIEPHFLGCPFPSLVTVPITLT